MGCNVVNWLHMVCYKGTEGSGYMRGGIFLGRVTIRVYRKSSVL